MIPRPRAILFDWDNTLVDSWGTIHEALCVTLAAMGHTPWSLEETRARVRLSLRDSFPALFGDRWEEAKRLYLETFTALHLERLTPLLNSATLLETLAEEGVYLGVVSNKTGRLLRLEAERLGWSRWFGALVGAGDARQDKPAADPVHLALAPANLASPAEAWFVGDTAVDMACAHAAGCCPVLFAGEPGEEASLDRFPPAFRVADARGLLARWRAL